VYSKSGRIVTKCCCVQDDRLKILRRGGTVCSDRHSNHVYSYYFIGYPFLYEIQLFSLCLEISSLYNQPSSGPEIKLPA
jgi:hypothetical protein